MSEKVTEVRTDSGAAIADNGHLPHADAVARLRRYLEHELRVAQDGLADIEAGKVHVFHQRGVHVVHNRREVQP
jgi:hypothetical protein